MVLEYAWNYRELDAKRWANFYDIPYDEPRERVKFDSELLARACTAAKHFGKVEMYSQLLFAEMFHSSLPKIIDERVCIAYAEMCELSGIDFQSILFDRQTTNLLDRTIDNAFQSGIFGVPTFMASGELFWGNDRLMLLHHHLRSLQSPN